LEPSIRVRCHLTRVCWRCPLAEPHRSLSTSIKPNDRAPPDDPGNPSVTSTANGAKTRPTSRRLILARVGEEGRRQIGPALLHRERADGESMRLRRLIRCRNAGSPRKNLTAPLMQSMFWGSRGSPRKNGQSPCCQSQLPKSCESWSGFVNVCLRDLGDPKLKVPS
jgi:hypothetical protein